MGDPSIPRTATDLEPPRRAHSPIRNGSTRFDSCLPRSSGRARRRAPRRAVPAAPLSGSTPKPLVLAPHGPQLKPRRRAPSTTPGRGRSRSARHGSHETSSCARRARRAGRRSRRRGDLSARGSECRRTSPRASRVSMRGTLAAVMAGTFALRWRSLGALHPTRRPAWAPRTDSRGTPRRW